MLSKKFWTDKRFEALGKACMTLCQAFIIAWAIGGFWNKLESIWIKAAFIITTFVLFVAGLVFADNPFKKES